MEYTNENKLDSHLIHCELLYICDYIQKPNSDELYTVIELFEKGGSKTQKWVNCYAIIENVKTRIQEEYLVYAYSPDKCHTQVFVTPLDEYRDCKLSKGFSNCENWKEQNRLSKPL